MRTRRPRKVVDTPVNGDASESNGLDASALPPAISISDDAEVTVEKKPVRKKRVVKPKVVEAEREEGDAA